MTHYPKIITNLLKYLLNIIMRKLYKKDNVYDIILVLNYNMNPIVKIKVVQYLSTFERKL